MMRALAWLGVMGLLLGGCRTRPCASGTILVELTRGGVASTADEIKVDVTLPDATNLHGDATVKPGSDEGTFQIDFAGHYPSGQVVTVTLTALHGGAVVATTDSTLTLSSGCDRISLTFGAPPDGGGLDGPDLACVPKITSCDPSACGQITDDCGGTVSCATPCAVNGLSPRLTNAGDAVVVEGTFSGASTATFPGSATATLTLLGAHRALATVPSTATAGSLVIHTGNVDINAGDFRRAAYTLSLQPGAAADTQAGLGREAIALNFARQSPIAVTTHEWIYVIGGSTGGATPTSLKGGERIRVNADGTLQDPIGLSGVVGDTVLLNTARSSAVAFPSRGKLYVLGGFDGASPLTSIESATINADGSLSDFALESVALNSPRQDATVAVIGNGVYVIGGTNGSTYYDTIEHATIAPDGTLGAFSVLPAANKLMTGRAKHASFTTQTSLVVVNGVGTGGKLSSVEVAPIMGDGTLGAFVLSTGSQPGAMAGEVIGARWSSTVYLRAGTGAFTATIAGDGSVSDFGNAANPPAATVAATGPRLAVSRDHLYELGGGNGGTTSAVATVTTTGLQHGASLAGFATDSVTLPAALGNLSAAVFADTLFVFGGSDTSGVASSAIYRAPINDDDTLGAFVAAQTLPSALTGLALAYANNTLYILGGGDGTNPTSASYQAAVKGDGSLGGISASVIGLGTARQGHVAFVSRSQVCVAGGNTGAATTNSVECASSGATGALSPFGPITDTTTVTLSTPREGAALVSLLGNLDVIGGRNGSSDLGTVEFGGVGPSASKPVSPTFANDVLVTLPGVRSQSAPLVVGDYVYLLGGVSGAVLSAHTVRADAVSFTTAFAQDNTAALATPRRAASAVLIGNRAYVIGGVTDPAATTTTASIEGANLQ
jgi:hypothetical protein